MNTPIYIPDLDDADFRRLIDARKLVVIKFWESRTNTPFMDEIYHEAAINHPEVAFAQANTEEHHGLKTRTQVVETPTLQGWVNGTMVKKIIGPYGASEIDNLIVEMNKHLC